MVLTEHLHQAPKFKKVWSCAFTSGPMMLVGSSVRCLLTEVIFLQHIRNNYISTHIIIILQEEFLLLVGIVSSH